MRFFATLRMTMGINGEFCKRLKSFFLSPSPSPPLGGEGIRGKDFWQTL
jgi:hypothetical protein